MYISSTFLETVSCVALNSIDKESEYEFRQRRLSSMPSSMRECGTQVARLLQNGTLVKEYIIHVKYVFRAECISEARLRIRSNSSCL